MLLAYMYILWLYFSKITLYACDIIYLVWRLNVKIDSLKG